MTEPTLTDRYGAGVEKAGVRHTPGPWRVEAGTTMIWGACNPDDRTTYGMGYPIAYCRMSPTDRWAKGPDELEGLANARLIAAAPDMLTSGKALADRDCIFDGGNIVIPCGSHGEALRLMNEFRAALSKATLTTGGPHD